MFTLPLPRLKSCQNARPLGASVPPLGLSNKALTDGLSILFNFNDDMTNAIDVPQVASSSHAGDVARRPFEGELASMTLWPEIEKVFGHGYEVRRAQGSGRFYS